MSTGGGDGDGSSDPSGTGPGSAGEPLVPGTNVPLSEFSLPQAVADRVGKAVMDRFAELMEGHSQHSRRKVRQEQQRRRVFQRIRVACFRSLPAL